MARQYSEIPDRLKRFIEAQPLFFVATAAPEGRVNLSPKGLDTLRILDAGRLLWLNLTGSGNETAAHLLRDPRMTLMFCAFEGDPLILRLYGRARVVHQSDEEWVALYSRFDPTPGARQLIDMQVELVQTSCGMGVPLMEYRGQRPELVDWARNKGDDGLRDYWREKNLVSIDGLPSGIEKVL
jgi:hypothetical protein